MAETRLVFKTGQECDAYEADARLGAAFRAALGDQLTLHIDADRQVWLGDFSRISTDETRALAALLSAVPAIPEEQTQTTDLG